MERRTSATSKRFYLDLHPYKHQGTYMDDLTKIKHSKRIQQKENYVNKQVKIAKAYGIPVKEPHRLQDHSALTCGNPNCVMCANPRKVFKELTIQEKKFIEKLKCQE